MEEHPHCENCFKTRCSFQECPVVECKHCKVGLHACKLDEHVKEVCRKAPGPCPNFTNGCDLRLTREKIPNHLPKCIASVVVCSRDRCRKINTKFTKINLKQLGRKQIYCGANPSSPLDIVLATHDQNQIIRSYHSSRELRVRQRDALHPGHPLLPLRNAPFDTSGPTEGDEDSSEDERRQKKEKLRKSRRVFADCHICQIDPSSQHLHTLGNGREIDNFCKVRPSPEVLDHFHRNNYLGVSIAIENVPETTRKSDNIREIKKGGTIYTFKCLKTIRRLDYGDHCLSQHTLTVDQLNEHIVRCPNWQNGCEFSTCRIKVLGGEMNFIPHTGSLTFKPIAPNQQGLANLENLPLWMYEEIAKRLPNSALYNLSMTSKKLRETVFMGFFNRCYVETVWRKNFSYGKWFHDANKLKITTAEPPPKIEWNVPVELSKHLATCTFFDAVKYEKETVSLFPQDIDKAIWKEFSSELRLRGIPIAAEVVDEDEQAGVAGVANAADMAGVAD